MRIAVNGWFHDQLVTGSGQYLEALAEWLPRAGEGHEFIVVKVQAGDAATRRHGENTMSHRPYVIRPGLARPSTVSTPTWPSSGSSR